MRDRRRPVAFVLVTAKRTIAHMRASVMGGLMARLLASAAVGVVMILAVSCGGDDIGAMPSAVHSATPEATARGAVPTAKGAVASATVAATPTRIPATALPATPEPPAPTLPPPTEVPPPSSRASADRAATAPWRGKHLPLRSDGLQLFSLPVARRSAAGLP